MEATATMRKFMALVLSVAAAACGTVKQPNAVGDDGDDDVMEPGIDAGTGAGSGIGSGAGTGSGSGSGSGTVDTGCYADSTCPAGNVCDLTTHECVPGCYADTGCPTGNVCDLATHACVPGCYAQTDCSTGTLCDLGTHRCATGCDADNDCSSGTVCDISAKMCVAGCYAQSECSTGTTCNLGTHRCVAGCDADNDCLTGSVCDLSSSTCVAGCYTQSDCSSGTTCNLGTHRCVAGCDADSDCSTGTVCDVPTSKCVAGCYAQSDCSSGTTCNLGTHRCVTGCDADSDCSTGTVCNFTTNTCVAGCYAETDCAKGTACDMGTHRCVAGCDAASDCASGNACELGTRTCVPGMISIDLQTDYIDDGTRWWTSTSAPVVRGTYSGPSSSVVKVKVGSTLTTATLSGGTWTAQLPQGSIASTDTPVTALMSDASGGSFSVAHTFVLDAAGPNISVEMSTVKDERGDTIDFSKGEPFHTHAGATIDLGAAGCPRVYKHPYLMDTTIPYGVNVTANPLAWRIRVSDMKLVSGSQQFRIKTDDGTILRDWASLPTVDGYGLSTIELTRKGGSLPIAALGTYTGQYFIEVKARDWSNNETVKSICFDYRPLQTPVAVSTFADTSMYSTNFAADMPGGFLIASSGTVDVTSQTVTNQTAEPTTITWSATSAPFSYTKSIYDGFVTEEKPENLYCISDDVRCFRTWTAPPSTGYQDVAGTFTPTLSIAVVDVTSGQTIASSASPSITVTLPARTIGGAARAYRFVVQTAPFTALQPASIGTTLGDYSLLGLKYTGAQPKDASGHCVAWDNSGEICTRVAYHYRFSAIDRATLTMSFTSRLQQSGVDAPYVSASLLSSGTRTWDSGNDDLPGTY